VTFKWDSPQEFTTFAREIAPPVKAMIDSQPKEVQEETLAAIVEAIRQQADDDGSVTLSNQVLLASGHA
jgi:hypothetical protein